MSDGVSTGSMDSMGFDYQMGEPLNGEPGSFLCLNVDRCVLFSVPFWGVVLEVLASKLLQNCRILVFGANRAEIFVKFGRNGAEIEGVSPPSLYCLFHPLTQRRARRHEGV